ncbi:MAG: hypothetical protein AAF846_02280 [Chloroflexota bacterium]
MTLGYFVFRLKIGDTEAWNDLKSSQHDLLLQATRSDLLNRNLPPGLLNPVVSETWKRAPKRISKFRVREDMTKYHLFTEFLLPIAREIEDKLVTVYHDVDSEPFVYLLRRPRKSDSRDDHNWAWQYLIDCYETNFKRTIYAVLATGIAHTDNDVDEICQRAYIKIQDGLERFVSRGQGALISWMHRYMQFEAHNFGRSRVAKEHKKIDNIDDKEYLLGEAFEDPFDSETLQKQEMMQRYHDAIFTIIDDLPHRPICDDENLSIDQQRFIIIRRFTNDFDKPAMIANALAMDIHIIYKIGKNVKRRLAKDARLLEFFENLHDDDDEDETLIQ